MHQLLTLTDSERQHVFRHYGDEEAANIMAVATSMPLVDMCITSEVLDDEDSGTITAGAIVTVSVVLTRQDMGVLLDGNHSLAPGHEEEDAETGEIQTTQSPQVQKPKFQKQMQKKKKQSKPQKKQIRQRPLPQKPAAKTTADSALNSQKLQDLKPKKAKDSGDEDSDDEHSSASENSVETNTKVSL